jgi:hypothetical protein
MREQLASRESASSNAVTILNTTTTSDLILTIVHHFRARFTPGSRFRVRFRLASSDGG